MALILLIETATKSCSVSLASDDKIIATKQEVNEQYSHAEKLTIFIAELFKNQDFTIQDLDAVAVSKGPGSYTGLRIGVSTAKGLCYALDIPLVAISTLRAMAFGMAQKEESKLYCPMIDARRMEVYNAFFNAENKEIRGVQADIINEKSYQKELEKSVLFFGDGAEKCKAIIIACNTASSIVIPKLQSKFTIPILDVITPLQATLENYKHHGIKKIGVIGTYNTIKSKAYNKVILNYNNKLLIISKECPLFVPIIEEGLQNHKIAHILCKEYLSNLDKRGLISKVSDYSKQFNQDSRSEEIIDLIKERCSLLSDFKEESIYFFEDFIKIDSKDSSQVFNTEAIEVLKKLYNELDTIEDWTAEKIHFSIEAVMSTNKVSMGKVGLPFRLTITGRMNSPPIDKTAAVIGKDKVMARLKQVITEFS